VRLYKSACLAFVLSLLSAVPPTLADDATGRGAKVFKSCAACHSMEKDSHRSGPSLYNIVNQPAGQANGYRYSNAMKKKAAEGLRWTEVNLHAFLEKPNRFIRLNKMKYPGLKEEADREAVIEYLKSHSE